MADKQNWEATIVSTKVIKSLLDKHIIGLGGMFVGAGMAISQAQGAVSFRDGRKAGIREGIRRSHEFMKDKHYIVDYDLDHSVEYLERNYSKSVSGIGRFHVVTEEGVKQ